MRPSEPSSPSSLVRNCYNRHPGDLSADYSSPVHNKLKPKAAQLPADVPYYAGDESER